MAKLNAVESDIESAKIIISDMTDNNVPASLLSLFQSAEMGMRSFRVLSGIRPLVAAVWQGMSDKGDPNRFAVERMLKEIDEVLGYWIVPDDGNDIEVNGENVKN